MVVSWKILFECWFKVVEKETSDRTKLPPVQIYLPWVHWETRMRICCRWSWRAWPWLFFAQDIFLCDLRSRCLELGAGKGGFWEPGVMIRELRCWQKSLLRWSSMSVPFFCKYFHHDRCMEKAVIYHKLVSIKEMNISGESWKTSASHWVMGRGTCLPDHLSNKQAFSIFLMFMFAVLGFALYNTSDPPGFEKQQDHLKKRRSHATQRCCCCWHCWA